MKNAGKRVCLNRVSNSQPPGHVSDMLTRATKVGLRITLHDFINNEDQGQAVLFGGRFIQLTLLSHNLHFKHPCIRSLSKTLLEKEKMLLISIFSFSHKVFCLPKTKLNFSFILTSAKALNLD